MGFRDALSPLLARETFDRWRSLRVGAKVPRKDDLCPLGLPPATLPYIMLMEWMGEGEEFRCRLIGDAIRMWYGGTVVGRSMRDLIPPSAHEQRAPLLRHCLTEGAPAWFTGPLLINKEPVRHGARLMLPVSFRGEAPDGIVMVAYIDDERKPLPTDDARSVALDTALTCSKAELD